MTLLSEIAQFVVRADIRSLPEDARAISQRHVFDALIAMAVGCRIPEGRALFKLPAEHGSPEWIGLVAAAARLTEIDDIHLPSCTTPSAVAAPVALALSVADGAAHSDLRSAIWVGIELVTRLGRAVSGPSILYRGVWPTYLAAPFGAAAVASKLLGLDEGRTAHALSLALMLGSGGIGRFSGAPSGRWFIFANAVASGIRAAMAARDQYSGDPGLLDGAWYRETHGLDFDTGAFSDLPGTSVFPTLSLKPYCAAKQTVAAVEALKRILATGVNASEISNIVVRVPPPYAGMVGMRATSGVRSSTLVSIGHQLALTAIAPADLYEVDRSGPITRSELMAFAEKVKIVADPGLLAYYPQHWPARIEATAGGTTIAGEAIAAWGDPELPLRDQEVGQKAQSVLDRIADGRTVEHWRKLIDEAGDSVAGCRSLLTEATNPPAEVRV